jgi:hypothetical protein
MNKKKKWLQINKFSTDLKMKVRINKYNGFNIFHISPYKLVKYFFLVTIIDIFIVFFFHYSENYSNHITLEESDRSIRS